MNAEISKIRRLRNSTKEMDSKPNQIDVDGLVEKVYELNMNLADLYYMCSHDTVDVNQFIEHIVANIYIVLDMFNEMNIYPDYFYDEMVKMKVGYEKLKQDNGDIRKDSREYLQVSIAAIKGVRDGVEKNYHVENYQEKDINDAFLEMIAYFQAFNKPYGVNTIEQCKKAFEDVQHRHIMITEQLINDDDIYDDIECLSKLLFEYIRFFVLIGVNPKDYLENYIETKEAEKRNSK